MFNIVLFEPEIPPNTGNIIRLCANTNTQLYLIKPLGFELADKRLLRAGLDYHEFTEVKIFDSLDDCLAKLGSTRVFALSTKGHTAYHTVRFEPNDTLLFGPETRGLPHELLTSFPADHTLTIPMVPQSRSLNLANAVSIVLFEALRQRDFYFT